MNPKLINFSLLVLLALRMYYLKQHKYFYNTIYFAASLLKLAGPANCSPTSPRIFPQSVFLSLFTIDLSSYTIIPQSEVSFYLYLALCLDLSC